jgi:hypothetical protein
MRVLVVGVALAAIGGCGQADDGVSTSDALYASDHVPVFRVHLDDAAADALRTDPHTYVRGDFEYGGVIYANVGVRLKGNASFAVLDNKPAFKIKLNEFVPGQMFLGMETLTLNNMRQDDAFVREWLSYEVFRAVGVPAPRAGYAEVYLNGDLLGLYANVESVDDPFLTRWFEDGTGPLYEGEYGEDVVVGGTHHLELDECEDPGGALLRSLAEAIDGDTDALFMGDDTPLDAWEFLMFSATEAAVGHWDGYQRMNNYRVYFDPAGESWSFIPWGTDQTLHRELDVFAGQGLVTRKCLGRQQCARWYADAVWDVASVLDEMDLGAELERIEDVIGDALSRDERSPHSTTASADRREDIRQFLAERSAVLRAQTQCFRTRDGPEADADGNLLRRPACPCPSVWVDGEQFFLCEYRLSWGGARDWCDALGLTLANIDDKAQNDELWSVMQEVAPGRWHIGLHASNGTDFAWPDGSPPAFDGWAPGQPSSSYERCTEMRGDDGSWHDTDCNTWQPFACSRPLPGGVMTALEQPR